MAQENWIEEFGKAYDVPAEILDLAGIVDTSWHNDICPSFQWEQLPVVSGPNGEAHGGLVLWVEHPDADSREYAGAVRFAITLQSESVCETDDVREAVDEFIRYREKLQPQLQAPLDVMPAIVEQLRAAQLQASVEHPGFISVWAEDLISHPDLHWAFGTANGSWDGDLQNGSGIYQGQTLHTGVPASERNPDAIAAAIVRLLQPTAPSFVPTPQALLIDAIDRYVEYLQANSYAGELLRATAMRRTLQTLPDTLRRAISVIEEADPDAATDPDGHAPLLQELRQLLG